MLRRCLKGFSCVALLLLALGLILFVPKVESENFSTQALSLAEGKGDDSLAKLSSEAWLDSGAITQVTSDDIMFINGNISPEGDYYYIKTALGLASVAYHINNGDKDYLSAIFLLGNDIDLQGAIWTPIGTAEHPFSGVFDGNGHKISNVVVQPVGVSSGSGQGLFGNINNAIISDLILDGTYSISEPTGGTLVGVATNSMIVSVRDNALDDVGGNASMQQIYTIGSNSSNVQVFLSTATLVRELKSIDPETSEVIFTLSIADLGELGKVDSQANIDFAGYAVYYFTANTSIYKYVNDELVNYFIVLVDKTFNDFSGSLVLPNSVYKANTYPEGYVSLMMKKNAIYFTHKPKLREQLSPTDTEVPYVVSRGYKVAIETPSVNDCYCLISPSEAYQTTLNLNYGYGNRVAIISGSYYDYSLDDMFGENAYLTDRLGFTVKSISTQSKGNISQEPSFYYNYPSYPSDTVNFEWTPLNDRGFDFYFLIDSESHADGSLTYAELSSAIGGVSVNKGTLDTNLVATNGRYTVKGLTSDDDNLANEVTLTFTLDAGYEISVVEEGGTQGSLIVDEDDVNNGFDGNNSYAYSKTSGVYLNFTNFTGEGESYNSANANNDSYCQVSASGSVRNTSGSGIVSSREERTYSITLSNIVGTTGNVYIVVKRAGEEINVVTSVYAFEDADLDSFSYTIDGAEYRENSFYIRGGLGQTVELTLKIDDDVNYFVLSANTSSSALTVSQVPVDGGRQMTVNGRTYYSYVTFRITVNSTEEEMALNVGIGGLRSYFKFVVQDGEGNILSPSAEDNSTKGISAVVNDIEGVGLNSTGLTEVREREGTLSDYVGVVANGYYIPTHITINHTGQGDVVTNAVLTFNEMTGRYEWTTTAPGQNIFNQIYQGGQDVDFTITITVKEAEFTLGWENFTFNISNGESVTSYTGGDNLEFLDDLFSLSFSSTVFVPGQSGRVTLTLTSLGLALLYGDTNNFNASSIDGFDETVNDGYLATTIDSVDVTNVDTGVWAFDFTSGTFEFDFNFDFTYKEITINASGLVLNGSYAPIDVTEDLFIGNSGSFRYSYTISDGQGQVSLTNASFGGIQIHTQYYNLGWYLKNGEVVTIANGNYNDIVTNANLISAYQDFSRASNASNFAINVQAIVAPRTVTLNYAGGEEQKGELVELDTSSDTITYSQGVTLKQAYKNKGYTFANYSYTIGTTNFSAKAGANFVITGLNFANLFGSGSLLQTWTSFVDESALTTSSATNLTLVSNWSVIKYNLVIDGVTTQSALEIGDEIRFIANEPSLKNGQGVYHIFREGIEVASYNGGVLGGYIAGGFELSLEGKLSATIDGDYASILFDGDNFDTLIGANYDTLRSITVSTIRIASSYKVYIENSQYFEVTISGSGDSFGQDENGVYVVVAYNALPSVLDKNSEDFLFNTSSITGRNITITRVGYTFEGDFYNFDPTEIFDSLSDITISPIFTKSNVSAGGATIKFSDDSTGANFFLLNSHNITIGSLIDFGDLEDDSDDITISLTEDEIILSNGDKVSGYGFALVKDGETSYYEGNTFNINNIYEDGLYSIYFYIDLVDTLHNSSENYSYRLGSQSLSFTMNKNAFGFDSNLVSAYNGTSEFVPTLSSEGYSNVNDYGSVYLVYGFAGVASEEKRVVFDTEDFFRGFVLTGGDYNVGENKDIALTIDSGYFTQVTNIGGVTVNSTTNFANLISGVVANGSDYVYTYEDGATIVKARFTISFGNTSSYYFDGVKLIVYTHDGNNRTFQIGREYFSYNLSRIVYTGGAVDSDTVFTGANRSVFAVEGLMIDGEDYQNNQDRCFEYVLDGQFKLLNSDNALKNYYSTRYLTATNGVLNDTLLQDYEGLVDGLYLTDVYVGGIEVEVEGSQFTYNVDDNVIFSVVNNGTGNLQIFVSRSALATHTLSYSVAVSLTNERLSHLTLLTFGTSPNGRDYDEMLNSAFSDPGGNADPYQVFTMSAESQNSTLYAILTDVRKLSFNYNGGHNEEGQTSDIIYLSYSSAGGEYILGNPSNNYSGLTFNGYFYSANGLTAEQNGAYAYKFVSLDGGSPVELIALWKLTGVDYTPVSGSVNLKASLSSQVIYVTNFVSPKVIEGGSYSFTLTKKDDPSVTFSSSDVFTFADSTGRVPISLGGEYTLTITLTFTNIYQTNQTISQGIDVVINIDKSTVGIIGTNVLTFNNADRKNDITLQMRVNGGASPQMTLTSLTQNGLTNYGVDVATSPEGEIRNAGQYEVVLSINSAYSDFFELESGYEKMQVTINKYDLTLADYANQIEVYKFFGQSDPNPIRDTITVSLVNTDSVELNFTRQAGESLGNHPLLTATLTDPTDINNYNPITDGFVAYFVIRVPDGGLFVRLDGNITYTYNGEALTSLSTRYNSNTQKFEVYGFEGNEQVSQSFSLYYLSEGEEIEVPISERETYARYITFNSSSAGKNVGTYEFSVSLSSEGQEADWSEANIDTDSIAQDYNTITVTKRTITLNAISKAFDQSSAFTFSMGGEYNGVSADISNYIEVDNIIINGVAESELAGQREIKEIALDSLSEANYTLELASGLQLLITPSIDAIEVKSNVSSLAYGTLSQDDVLSKILEQLPLIFNEGEISSSYINVTAYQFVSPSFSTGGYLEAGSNSVSITLTSSNYTFGGGAGEVGEVYQTNITISFEVTRLEFAISNSDVQIIKEYDGDNLIGEDNLNQVVNGQSSPYYSAELLSGDIIRIIGGQYNDSEVGNNKKITLLEFDSTSDDSNNYIITYPVLVGAITNHIITFNVDATTEHIDLVTDGAFVKDGLSPIVQETFFTFEYPNLLTGLELLSQMELPTRVGYTATGWAYKQGNNYLPITVDNIQTLIRDVALDETNPDETITIYVIWHIDNYKITVAGDGVESFEVSGQYYDEETQSARYFSDISIDVVVDKGYKIARYEVNGSYSRAVLDDVDGNSGTAEVFGVGSDLEITVYASEIEITFNIDTNIPDYTSRTDTNRTYLTYKYPELVNMFARDLPAFSVTAGTYTLAGFSYSGGDIGALSLKEVVDNLYPNLDEDVNVDLTANWAGVQYVVTFNPAGGTLTGESSQKVTYGSAFTSPLPTATLPGRSGVWTDANGVTYADGSVFHTIGTLIEGVWNASLVAEYQNNTYILTVQFDNRLQVFYNGSRIASGETFDVTYDTTNITFTITPLQGYGYDIDTDSLNGSVTEGTNSVSVYNLTEDGVLNIVTVRGTNRMTIAGYNIDGYSVIIDDVEQPTNSVYNVLTESIVKITFTASFGYEFEESCLSHTTTDSTIDIEISQDKKTMTVTWSNFTSDITFTVEANPTLNTVTYNDVSSIFTSLQFNGESVALVGGEYGVYTEEGLEIVATLRYGYFDGKVTASIASFLTGQECNYLRADGLYHLEASLEDINESFSLTFTATERSYNFVIAVESGSEEIGQITVSQSQTVQFGQNVQLGVTLLREDYVFAGWKFNGEIISRTENSSIELTSSLRQMLESVTPGQSITIYATFIDRVTSISFTAGNHGQIIFYQEDSAPTTVNGGRTEIGKVRYGYDLIIDILPDEGYRLDKILVDGEVTTEGYDQETSKFTIYLDAVEGISTVEITFTAKEITVNVQAVVQRNYELIYGDPTGGLIYLVDSEGVRLGDEYYICSSDKLYFDYTVDSVTNGTLYFALETRSGYNAILNSTTEGVVVSEYTANGTRIWAVSGLCQGANIQAIFIAVENNIEVRFVTADTTTALSAGQIRVDTSSIDVRASQNNTHNTFISVVTGATISMDIYSMFTYDLLADEQGNLNYYVVYSNGAFDEGAVVAGLVEESDIYSNGFTKRATLEITNANASATIYILVEPRVYSLNFYVTENISVKIENTLIYGQALPMTSLTEEQRALVFSTRSGYTLGGYYTMQLAKGTHYLDGNGNLLKNWSETGYRWTGYGYVPTDNFDEATQTFTIYAAWIYDRASIDLNFLPIGFSGNFVNLNIKNFITNIASIGDNVWMNQTDNWYVEVPAGVTLHFDSIPVEGYQFINFLVSINNGETVTCEGGFDLEYSAGSYSVTAIYQPILTLTTTEGGSAQGLQSGVEIGQSFSPDIPLTLRATAEEGYNFLYFLNIETNERYYAQFDNASGSYNYTFVDLISTPLRIRAVFEGKPITINIDFTGASGIHRILNVYLDGRAVSYSGQILANVGQSLVIVIEREYGYAIAVDGGIYSESVDNNGNYRYTFALTAEGLIEDGESYILDIDIDATRENVNLSFDMKVKDAVNDNEILRAGTLSYVDGDGNTYNDIKAGSAYQILYGESVSLRAYTSANYRVSDVLLDYDGEQVSLMSYLLDNTLIINESFLNRYQAYNLKITIVYSRLVWTDEEVLSGYIEGTSRLLGSGTASNPYYIRSTQELAFVAYAVNNGLTNSDDILYSEAYYEIVADISLSGRFWEPIGVPDSPFNGTMDLGEYVISGLILYRSYPAPELSYGGLFWCLGDNARILKDTDTLTLVLWIIFALIILAIIIVIIVHYYRKYKRRKMNDIANN